MPDAANGTYTPNPWMQDIPTRIAKRGQFYSYEDQMTAQALAAAMEEPADKIRAIRPPLPIVLFPPRFGYRQEALGIRDVIRLDTIYQRYDFSGKQSGYQGSSYPSLNQF